MRGGNRANGIGRGIGKITNITNTTLTGEIYFEIHPDQLDQNLGWFQESLIVEMYGGIEFGLSDCAEGIMLGKRLVNMTGFDDAVENFGYQVLPFNEYNDYFRKESIACHPRSTNADIAAVVFTLNDPYYYNEQSPSIMNLWYPFRMGMDFGSMEFCIRIEMIDPTYNSEDDDFTDDYFKKRNVTSYMDTKFKVEVVAPTEANNFTRFQEGFSEVKVYSNQPIGPVEGLTTFLPPRYNETNSTESPTSAPTTQTEIVIPVATYQCSAPDESDVAGKYDPDRTFYLGQTFRVCVSPTEIYEEDYAVIGFQDIVCENSDRNITIINEFGIPDMYTTISLETIGFTKKSGGIITSSHTASINSVITADLSGIFPDGETYFVCTGIVFLDYVGSDEETDGGGMKAVSKNEASALGQAESAAAARTTDLDSVKNDTSWGNRQRVRRAASSAKNHPGPPQRFASRLMQEQNWDKMEGNNLYEYQIPIIGALSIRIDLTTTSTGGNVNKFFSNSVDTLKDWFQISSSAPHTSVHNNFLFGTVLFSLWFLA